MGRIVMDGKKGSGGQELGYGKKGHQDLLLH